MINDLALNTIDTLGALLAQIADLTKQADAIKDAIKDAANAGGPKVVEGALFKATIPRLTALRLTTRRCALILASPPIRSPSTTKLPLFSASKSQAANN